MQMAGNSGGVLGAGYNGDVVMEIHGFNKTTLLDYPGYVAATVFTGGCNFRCPFCHNGGLVLDPKSQKMIPEEEVFAYLKKRQGILDGVCITGGEATLQPDLQDFIKRIKELGYLVKLDTNGYRPEVLWALLREGLVDYVAMDIKASRKNYARAAGVSNLDLARIEESVGILKSCEIPYEFRTTVVKGIHTVEEFEAIGKWLEGCRAYYLQAFQENENIIEYYHTRKSEKNENADRSIEGEKVTDHCGFSAFEKVDMERMAEIAKKYIDNVVLRGVE